MFAPVEEETPGTSWEQRPGLPLEPVRFVWALRRKARLIALAVAFSIPLGVGVAFTLAPREYVAHSVLVWEPLRSSSVPARELQTVTKSVKLPSNVEEVRRRLQLTDRLEEVGGRIQVGVVSTESNILTISGRADTAEEAARFTQTVTDVFLEARVRIARTRTEERLKALTEEIERLLGQLSSARERYDQFRSRHHILDLALDRKSAIEELAFLRNEANKNRIEADSGSVKAKLLRSAAQKASPQIVVMENQIQANRQKLAELSAQLTARRASLSQEHPEVLGLQASVEALEQKTADTYTVTGRQVGANPEWMLLQEQLTSTAADQQATDHKWQSYARLQASLNERLLQLSAVEGEASLLLADVQIAEQRLSQLKAEQKVLETEFRQPSPEVRVLNAPVPPPWPAQSARRKVALAFPILTGLLVVLFLVGRELRGLRMRTPSEIAFWANAPVLASSSWPTEPEELRNLALELASQLKNAGGTTLVVPFAPSRSGRAAELVEALRAQTPAKAHPAQEGSLLLWDNADRIQALRRASRESSRVLVLVEGDAHSPLELAGLRRLLGRDDGLGLVVLGLSPELALLRDRVGDGPGFWRSPLPPAEAMSPGQGTLTELHPPDHRQRLGLRR
jgi:uncharacterized protein involved in exopolysaccharide biosynthesis